MNIGDFSDANLNHDGVGGILGQGGHDIKGFRTTFYCSIKLLIIWIY